MVKPAEGASLSTSMANSAPGYELGGNVAKADDEDALAIQRLAQGHAHVPFSDGCCHGMSIPEAG